MPESGIRRLAAASLIIVLFAALLPAPVGAEEVTSDLNTTGTVGSGQYADYHLTVASGKEASVHITADGTVDFYVISESLLAGYQNPFNDFFVAESSRERARDFTAIVRESGKVVVIDNVDKSQSGATPTGPVSYTIRVSYRDSYNPLLVCGVGLLIVMALLAVSYVVWSRRQKRRTGGAGTSPPPPPP